MTSIIAMPFVRYYFGDNNIKPYLQGAVGFGSSKTNIDFYDSASTSNLVSYGFDGGIAIFLNENVSLDVGAGYTSSTSKPQEDNSNNVKFINNAFGLNAGFNIYF